MQFVAARPMTFVVGDDWLIDLAAVSTDGTTPFDITGYVITGEIDVPLSEGLDILPWVVVTDPIAGTVTLTVPRAVTADLLPSDQGYLLRVAVIDPLGSLTTRGRFPLRVIAI